MSNWVSTTEKRQFIKWFLDNHQLKHKDARMVLEYILQHHHILENLSFTEKIRLNEKTIVISTMHSDEPGFIYYYNQKKTDDISKTLGSFMSNPAEKTNIILHFYGKQSNHRYLQLVEPSTDSFKRYKQFQQDAKEADSLLDKVLLEQEMNILKLQIDRALDQNDKQTFTRLVARLQELKDLA